MRPRSTARAVKRDTLSSGRQPSRSSVWAWVGYDLANTIFALGVIGLYLPQWIVENDLPDSALSLATGGAGLVVAFLAPWVGMRTDYHGNRIPALAITTGMAVCGSALLAVGPILLTMFIFGASLIGFHVGSAVYDSLLLDVSTPETRSRVSGMGVALGYLGSFIGLGIGTLVLEVGGGYPAVFRSLAFGFAVFSLPAFFLIQPARPSPPKGEPPPLRRVIGDLFRSWKATRRYPNLTRFLVGRFCYAETVNTLVGGFLAIYATEEVGLTTSEVTVLLGAAIAASMAGGFVGGGLAERLGPGRGLRLILGLWVVTIALGVTAALSGAAWLIWVAGLSGGVSLGGLWATDRVVMTGLSPPERVGEFYGLYATVGRFAAVLGPLLWGFIVDVLGMSRHAAMVSLILIGLTALWVLRGINPGPGYEAVSSDEDSEGNTMETDPPSAPLGT
ncbi:MAG: MFS transporter [Acidimicrobiia bacterium]|nr:MFS transporter [Acidimicrobiia bacterium]